MVYFRPNLGIFWWALNGKILVYFGPFGIFDSHFVYFVEIWHNLWPFGIHFIILVFSNKAKPGNPASTPPSPPEKNPICRKIVNRHFQTWLVDVRDVLEDIKM
jgi:hypothetical protein